MVSDLTYGICNNKMNKIRKKEKKGRMPREYMS